MKTNPFNKTLQSNKKSHWTQSPQTKKQQPYRKIKTHLQIKIFTKPHLTNKKTKRAYRRNESAPWKKHTYPQLTYSFITNKSGPKAVIGRALAAYRESVRHLPTGLRQCLTAFEPEWWTKSTIVCRVHKRWIFFMDGLFYYRRRKMAVDVWVRRNYFFNGYFLDVYYVW